MTGTESQLLQWAIQIGGPMAAIVLLAGYFYRKDMKEGAAKAAAQQQAMIEQYREDMKYYTDQMKAVSDEWKGQSAHLIQIVKENTVAFSQNTAVVQSLHAHIAEGDRRSNPRNPER